MNTDGQDQPNQGLEEGVEGGGEEYTFREATQNCSVSPEKGSPVKGKICFPF